MYVSIFVKYKESASPDAGVIRKPERTETLPWIRYCNKYKFLKLQEDLGQS